MQSYYWVKTFHIVFVVAWMATVFYLPRILVNLAETAGQPAVTERLQLMGLRLYRFGHSMFGLAFLLALGVKALAGPLADDDSTLHTITSTIGPSVSGVFLWVLGLLNLAALLGILKVFGLC